jgi:predicted RNA-binding Zn ribbon-like protein
VTVANTSERPPAPGSLQLVQAFVNTLDVESGQDLLSDGEGLAAWLREQALPGADGRLDSADVAIATELREALRALLHANAGGDPDPAATALVNRLSERALLRVELGLGGGVALREAGRQGIDAALARILAAAYVAMIDGTWARLKACLDQDCGWAFYDRSRNRSGHWCDMAVCGSRHKVRAYRARRHTPSQ